MKRLPCVSSHDRDDGESGGIVKYATEPQINFIEKLARSINRQPSEAVADVVGEAKEPSRLTTEEASRVITALRTKAGLADPDTLTATAMVKRPSPAGGGRYLTARQLRRIATGDAMVPAQADEDAQWVLSRLDTLAKIEHQLGIVPPKRGVNGSGPVAMEQLLAYFGDWDTLAKAFEVTVSTAKAWGSHLPAGRAYEAEVKTRGYVRALTREEPKQIGRGLERILNGSARLS